MLNQGISSDNAIYVETDEPITDLSEENYIQSLWFLSQSSLFRVPIPESLQDLDDGDRPFGRQMFEPLANSFSLEPGDTPFNQVHTFDLTYRNVDIATLFVVDGNIVNVVQGGAGHSAPEIPLSFYLTIGFLG